MKKISEAGSIDVTGALLYPAGYIILSIVIIAILVIVTDRFYKKKLAK
ncbi:hypothetical protein [Kineothrix sedimenti]|uniref:Uncharacterized protein n=1 Tax=Kineothrix sedimenti TaxID=3123317 RepID=A0ABZ3EZ28_9FIRM